MSEAGISISFFKLREFPGQSGLVFITLGGYAAAVVMGAMAAAKPPMLRWQAIVALVGFALVFLKMREGGGAGFMNMLTKGAIGAKMMWIGLVGGIVVSIAAIAKPEAAK
ncbi:MAG: hypothetical protein HOV81_44030 [Kofleriaceae bacterium]|nr:hypothetical protein [Kofleriaceae bacterium]